MFKKIKVDELLMMKLTKKSNPNLVYYLAKTSIDDKLVELGYERKPKNKCVKKGKKQPVKGASDTEIIPLSEDSEAYMKKNVLPYNPLAYIDPAKDKIGYEVPFTRLFYKFEAPASSDSIFEEIKALEAEETILMKELLGHA